MRSIFAILLLTPSIGLGAISLVFSDSTASLSNLANFSGDTGAGNQDGLAWGIVIDTTGDNFSSPLAATVGLKVEDGANFGNGYLFFYGGITATVPFGNEPGVGGVGTSASMDVYSSAGVAQNQKFAVMWFDTDLDQNDSLTAGDNYGLEQNAAFLLPADGGDNISYAAASAGADPLRTANLSLVPEPSTALLAFLGLAGLLRRKR